MMSHHTMSIISIKRPWQLSVYVSPVAGLCSTHALVLASIERLVSISLTLQWTSMTPNANHDDKGTLCGIWDGDILPQNDPPSSTINQHHFLVKSLERKQGTVTRPYAHLTLKFVSRSLGLRSERKIMSQAVI